MDKPRFKLLSPNMGFYYSSDLFLSDAYQDLTISARNLLFGFLIKRRWSGPNEKKGKIVNNGEIVFTEKQFRMLFGGCSATYIQARNQLIRNGLIYQTYQGGMCRGDCAQYKVLCIVGVPWGEQKWRRYPIEDWEKDVPKRKNQTIGLETRWKKGRSGRVLKATL